MQQFTKAAWPTPETPVANLLITVTDLDRDAAMHVPTVQAQLQDATTTISLTELSSPDQANGRFTGSIFVYSQHLPTQLGLSSLLQWGETLSLTYQDSRPAESVSASFAMPAPMFVDPTPSEGSVLATAEACALVHLLKVQDTSGFQVEMVPTRFWSDHDWHGVPEHKPAQRDRPCKTSPEGVWGCQAQGSYRYPAGHGLMPGASLEHVVSSTEEQQLPGGACDPDQVLSTACGSRVVGVQTAAFSWTATAHDKGRVWTQCLVPREPHGAMLGPERCFRIHTQRCRRCSLRGESLYAIASQLGTEWGLLFSINHELRHFSVVPAGLRVQTGLMYRSVSGDTVQSLARRFGLLLQHLLDANPEASQLALVPGNDVCISPALSLPDACPPQPPSSTWEPIEEQYVPPDYWDNPFNWEDIEYSTDPRGYPTKRANPLYPQRPRSNTTT